MIKVNKIEGQKVEYFAPDGTSLGFLNEYENLDLSIQIAEQKAEGYYLMFNNKKVQIKSDGDLEHWPSGLFDNSVELLKKLFYIQGKGDFLKF